MTTVPPTTLAAWLLTQIAADEKIARAAEGWFQSTDWTSSAAEEHGDNFDPARVLAECEAHRKIVAALDYTPCPCARAERCVQHDASAGPPAVERYVSDTTNAVLRALALPYADRDGYRETWRP